MARIMRSFRRFLSSKNTFSPPEMPRPPPLADVKDQKEMEDLILEKSKHPDPPAQKPISPDDPERNPVTGEIGGPKGKEPTRFGDWERKGRISDF